MSGESARPTVATAAGPARRRGFATAATLYVVLMAVIFASAVVVALFIAEGATYWVMALLGAFVINAIISGAALPSLMEMRK